MGGWTIGVIGGSGLYEIDGLGDAEPVTVETPWGAPSDTLVRGTIGDVTLVFLPRHGKGHRLTPTDVPYRANIDALKRLGCSDVLSISACGSLKEQYAPGDFVMVDQFIDRTFARNKTFFGPGMVAHVSMAEPVCSRLSGLAGDAAASIGAAVHRGGTYLAMEGPQFSSRAESHLYRQWGCDVIGMTNMPEAKLAREAELPYATIAMVTDYDCWRDDSEAVSVSNVLEVIKNNTDKAKKTLLALVENLQGTTRTPSPQGIETCLDFAMITAPTARDPALLAKLDAVAGRVL
ncbi:S-methyl-5'-thioadenosine phosphorylase [Henriciella pelagia]|jgi:5'-methylthioadenosine phosphorylase|uniref:S-methyl-5'-thioadenosine phosphorylase n=1 Tax=Henriciella pelagia TaxID=1977912 RepID=A0ABQ1JDF0_9PROT|nr:S-methyl-5'-thioadenosine phosphorylase [Henriciella pelagia]GGB65561.1 S-methyl-5'-thioadenosine phosphorylase [Henriciella pelagia]